MTKNDLKNNLAIYKDKKGNIEFHADISKETIWATQIQIAQLFGIERSVITKHIHNLLRSKEVDTKNNVQKMHIANSDKPVSLYSLDVVLAVGYKTNSSKAIIFRQWATKTLRHYVIKGYVLNQKRLAESNQNTIKELQTTLGFIQSTIKSRQLDQFTQLIK